MNISTPTVDELLANKPPINNDWADHDELATDFVARIRSMSSDQLQRKWPQLLPFLLQISTHFRQQTIGVQALKHVLLALPSTFVQKNGLDRMLLHHLGKLFYQTDIDLLRNTLDTLETLCQKSPGLIRSVDQIRPDRISPGQLEPDQGAIDQIMVTILDAIQMTSNRELKVTLIASLSRLYSMLDRRVWKHTKRLLDIHCELLNSELGLGDAEEKRLALQSLHALIAHCRPMATLIQVPILKILLKLALALEHADHPELSQDKQIRLKLIETLLCLRQIDEANFESLIQETKQLPEFESIDRWLIDDDRK